jgi:hypothetical protein
MNASAMTDAITACVALNPSLENGSSANIHRIAGKNNGTITNNQARSDMTIATTVEGGHAADEGGDKVDGAGCDAKPAQSVYEGLGWDFTGVWKMGGSGCPVLKWQP